ncbi:MAG: hypothetical protein GQF41_3617 [Candidatus Rifleibacterium amylolyticum]|nr:MAG: hypothetical protein GQF41_3617 [Candidatus Rifleibacterium amylolyticum]
MTDLIRRLLQSRSIRILLLTNIPVFLVYVGLILINQRMQDREIDDSVVRLKTECEALADSVVNTEHFICSRLRDMFWANWQNPQRLHSSFSEFLVQNKLDAELIAWDQSRKVVFCNFDYQSKQEQWQRAIALLSDFHRGVKYARDEDIPADELLNLRKLLGNLVFARQMYGCANPSSPILAATSFSQEAHKLWFHVFNDVGIIVFLKPARINDFSAVRSELERQRSEHQLFRFFHYRKGRVFPDSKDNEWLQSLCQKISGNFKKLYEHGSNTLYCSYLSEDEMLIGVFDRTPLLQKDFFAERKSLLIGLAAFTNLLAIFLFILVPVSFYNSLKTRLLVLFAASSMLPLLAFAVIAFDYVQEYRGARIAEINRVSLRFLQKIDEGTGLAYSDQINTLRKYLPVLQKDLRENGISKGVISRFLAGQKPELRGFFLVGSQTSEIGCEDAVFNRSGVVELIDNEENSPPHPAKKTQAKATDIVFKSFLATMNKTSVSDKQGLEAEMVFDSIGQTDKFVLVQSYFETLDGVWKYGFGRNMYPSYITLLKSEHYDYNLIAMLDEEELAMHFAEKTIDKLSRNPFGIKILLKVSHHYFPHEIENDFKTRYQLDIITEAKSGSSSIIDFNGEGHLAIALHGFHNRELDLMALFPLAEIERSVQALSFNFWLAGILSAMVVLSLSLLISRTVTEPIGHLRKGVNALHDRNFRYRLPDLGRNEFGHLAEMFNQTLSDMDELQVASLVQEKLIPQFEEDQHWHDICFFGRTESLDDLGGDYFDQVETDDGKIGFLLGDVAGHGVAASLLVAFVKAAVLRLKLFYAEPQTFFNELNRLFRQTKDKRQQKFMSLQYTVFAKDSQEFSFINAGHCFPVRVDPVRGETELLQMISSPLGTSRKDYPPPMMYELTAGQALVMYSDGYVEMPGMSFELFQSILLQCYDSSPQQYFINVNQHLTRQGYIQAGDDKTLLIILRKKV